MARFDCPGLDKVISDMQRMAETGGKCAEAMVDQAVVIIRDSWRESAERHGHRDTGAMIESVGFPNPTVKMGDILSRDVFPQGKDEKGTRNAEKAFILNYGKSRFPGTYWVDEAEAAADPKVAAALEQMWDQYLKTGKVPVVIDTGK